MLNLLVSKVTPLRVDFCALAASCCAFFSAFSFENASPPSPLRAAYGVVMSGFGPRGRRVGGLAGGSAGRRVVCGRVEGRAGWPLHVGVLVDFELIHWLRRNRTCWAW